MDVVYRYSVFILLTLFCVGCKESFEPNLPPVPQGYLVVEGFINAEGPTEIKLSRTNPLDDKKTFGAERGATIKIEGDDNSSFSLDDQSKGIYSSPSLILNASHKYRLHIKTADSKEYLSDYVAVKITPAIDSISWKEDQTGVTVYADTHDDQNRTIYYKWDYDETWEIHSAYASEFNPNIYICWKYDTSSAIVIGSSAKLEKDIIHWAPIVYIPEQDEKTGIRYSIQVKQYAVDKEEYEFLEQMKKNTESLGSIFDPQPSVIRGNVHSLSNVNELVIGYIGVTTMKKQRIFISSNDLKNRSFQMIEHCSSDSIEVGNIPPGYLAYRSFRGMGGRVGFIISETKCVDCRAREGINIKPDFW